jgi:hypothetical protein
MGCAPEVAGSVYHLRQPQQIPSINWRIPAGCAVSVPPATRNGRWRRRAGPACRSLGAGRWPSTSAPRCPTASSCSPSPSGCEGVFLPETGAFLPLPKLMVFEQEPGATGSTAIANASSNRGSSPPAYGAGGSERMGGADQTGLRNRPTLLSQVRGGDEDHRLPRTASD